MHGGNVQDLLRCKNRQHIDNTGGRHTDSDIPQQGDLPVQHQLPDKISGACAKKCADHLHRTAAQQKGKCAAGNRRGKPQIPRLIVGGLFLDVIQHLMELIDGVLPRQIREIPHKHLQFHQLVRVDTRRWQRKRLCIGFIVPDAGTLNGNQTNVGGTGNPKTSGHLVHRIPHTPRTGSHRQHHQPKPPHKGRLFL